MKSDKRLTKYPFNQEMAYAICEAIAYGARLTKLSSEYPSYNIICRWRRDNPEFNSLILIAYQDRREFFLSQLLNIKAYDLSNCSLQSEIHRQVGIRYSQNLKMKTDRRREVYMIDTGINKLITRGGVLTKIK